MIATKTPLPLITASLTFAAIPASAELVAGWDTWENGSNPTASRVAPGVTGTAVSTTEGSNWHVDDGRGASADGDWGNRMTVPPASVLAGEGVNNQNLELSNATTGGTLTFTITNESGSDIVLDSFNFDSYAFRPKAARDYVLSVVDGSGITPGVIYTSEVDEITSVAGAWDNLAHDDIEHSLAGLEDHTLEPGESVDFLLVFSGGAGDSSGGHDLWVDNVGIFTAPPSLVGPPVTIEKNGSDLTLTWDSESGKLYTLRSDSAFTSAPINWPVFADNMDIEATPPQNTLTFAQPDAPAQFFAIEEFDAPPIFLLMDDFENGQGDWTVGSDDQPGTVWELGAPSVVGPAMANSGANCFGTNIAAEYADDANIWLRSPAIDLTDVTVASLNFAYFLTGDGGFDVASVNVVDAADDSLIAEIEPLIVDDTGAFIPFTRALPSDAYGKTVKIEFRFDTDDIDNSAGWYIDDVEVTTPR